MVFEVLAWAIRQEKGVKGIQIGKQKVKAIPFSNNMVLSQKP